MFRESRHISIKRPEGYFEFNQAFGMFCVTSAIWVAAKFLWLKKP